MTHDLRVMITAYIVCTPVSPTADTYHSQKVTWFRFNRLRVMGHWVTCTDPRLTDPIL